MESSDRVLSERATSTVTSPATMEYAEADVRNKRVVLCPHISLAHYRGGEKWVTNVANKLADEGVDVSIRALPYVPDDRRRVDVGDVLDTDVSYEEAWRHDLTPFDAAYVFYNPLSTLFFAGDAFVIAGIHSWVYVSDRLLEPHYGLVPTVVKWLYRAVGRRDLNQFDLVHSVTPAFRSPHPNTAYIPNYVDATQFHPDRAPLHDVFTVLVTAAHIAEKGWDRVQDVAARLPPEIRLAATGTSEDPNIHDLGFLSEEELARAYAASHVVLHPARVDTDSMVINEATAAGTPVITTPIRTHVRENRAILHAGTTSEMVGMIMLLHREWERGIRYAERCSLARSIGERRDVDRIYPRLKQLLLRPEDLAE